MSHEIIFWCVAALLILIACAFVVPALLGHSFFRTKGASAEETSRVLLAQQMESLKADLDAGLLDKAGYEASVEDVRRRALQDISEARGRTLGGKGAPVATALTVCVLMTVSVLGLYQWFGAAGSIDLFDSVQKGGIMRADGTLGLNDRAPGAAELKAFLETHPKDERAWVLYGRALAQSSDWQGAADAYEKAVSLGRFAGKDTDVLMEYGAATMNLRTEAAYKKAVEILTQAAVIDEKQPPGAGVSRDGCVSGARLENGAYCARIYSYQGRSKRPGLSEHCRSCEPGCAHGARKPAEVGSFL